MSLVPGGAVCGGGWSPWRDATNRSTQLKTVPGPASVFIRNVLFSCPLINVLLIETATGDAPTCSSRYFRVVSSKRRRLSTDKVCLVLMEDDDSSKGGT